ncbi:hypothetical protein TWF481_003111 [Arthrobotrys musiformis]|uniref:Uncharacterized protein n=1 Tax=Arthrobotrys musiformis TaxID=47236 RepID=A0AAV9VPK1_9PEZI
MCYRLEEVFTCGHTKLDPNVQCSTPKSCQMDGEPGVWQRQVDKTCGDKDCEPEVEDDGDDDEDDDEDDGDNEDGNGDDDVGKGSGKKPSRSFESNGSKSRERQSWVTTRSTWLAENPAEPDQKREGDKSTQRTSTALALPQNSKDASRPQRKAPPNLASNSSQKSTSQSPRSGLASEFDGLSIFVPGSPIYSQGYTGETCTSLFKFPSLAFTNCEIMVRSLPKGYLKGRCDAVSEGEATNGPAGHQYAEPGLKSAMKMTNYAYVRPRRVTRSRTAAEKQIERARNQQKPASEESVKRLGGSPPIDPGLGRIRAVKKVRFAAGSKETSGHVVLELPESLPETDSP